MGDGRVRVLSVLSDGRPRTFRDVVREAGLGRKAVEGLLYRLWREGLILRTEKPHLEVQRIFRGRAGVTRNLRKYHHYVLRPAGKDYLEIDGMAFIKYDERMAEARGVSKAKCVYEFLRRNCDRAFFSKEIAEALKGEGVKPSDVMSSVRRLERKGLVYVRGYRTGAGETPFNEGYLITWIDPSKPREQAIEDAVERTEAALMEKATPIMMRIRQIRDLVIEASKLGEIISLEYLQNRLGCSEYELETALKRAMQLYPDIKELKLFRRFRHYAHASMDEEQLRKAVKAKENYIRVVKGRENRLGHNWEACVEWFIDKFTTGAHFMTQDHRNKGMDKRRITLYLMKSVGGRVNRAEVDRVWTVTPGIFTPPITYVLECKWGLISKRDVDDFLEVLRWSKEFGVDTPEGRQVKQGIVGVFAGSTFNPREKVKLKDDTVVDLPTYANRMNIQLLKASDFNRKLRERGCRKTTVQKICRLSRDEDEVRKTLEALWDKPEKEDEILAEVAERNMEIYEFEDMLKRLEKIQ